MPEKARPAQIVDCLQGEAQYSKETIQVLEKFLDDQFSTGSYDLEANLALLKLYALYPASLDQEKVNQVLIKALMNFPNTDFGLCMYQIPEQTANQLKEVIKLATLMETAKFKQFWAEAEKVEMLKKAKNFETKVRQTIASVVAITYRAVQMSTLAELLNLKEKSKDIEKIIKEQGWKTDGSKVLVNPNLRSTSEQQTENLQEMGPPSVLSLDEYKRVISVVNSA